MHSYEPHHARHAHVDHGSIPAMRPPHEPATDRPVRSATPIFDALYAEYRRLFRALPGDRSGEDELGFGGFGTGYGTGFAPGPYGRRHGAHRATVPAALPPGTGSPVGR